MLASNSLTRTSHAHGEINARQRLLAGECGNELVRNAISLGTGQASQRCDQLFKKKNVKKA